MFIRTKKINKKDYAYLVANKWTKKGTRQKTVKYLGKVYSCKCKNLIFDNFVNDNLNNYLQNNDYENIICDLVKWELLKNDFKETGKNIMVKKLKNTRKNCKAIFCAQRNPKGISCAPEMQSISVKIITINLNKKNIFTEKIVLKNNEGFLCNHTIRKILNFNPGKEEIENNEEKVMFDFAETFVNAGINVPKEVFVDLFEKVVS